MEQETLSVDQSETLQQLNQSKNLPVGNQPQAGEQEPPESEPVEQEVPSGEEGQTAEDRFEYDGQVFASEKDAFEYMKGKVGQLETERLLDEARMEGRTEAMQYIPQYQQNQAQQPQPEPEEDVDMDKFYENPAGFLKEYGQKIYDKVKNEVNQSYQQQLQAEKVWTDFTNRYPDLADFREDVDAVANKHAETIRALASRNPDKAYEFVATKTREKFQKYAEALKPTRVLSNSKAGPSTGGNPSVTKPQNRQAETKPLDFAAQLRSIRRR